MLNIIIERQLLKAIESARKSAEMKLLGASHDSPENEFKQQLDREFKKLNNLFEGDSDDWTVVDLSSVKLKREIEGSSSHGGERAALGGGMVLAGAPVLKKRFVMAGSAGGTSVASKYLARALPQKMPRRILGTVVLGRAVGRAVPYTGWALLALEAIELTVESFQPDEFVDGARSFRSGFGGNFGGAGSSGQWN